MGSGQSEEVTADEIVAEMRRWNKDEGWRQGYEAETAVAALADHIENWLKGKR